MSVQPLQQRRSLPDVACLPAPPTALPLPCWQVLGIVEMLQEALASSKMRLRLPNVAFVLNGVRRVLASMLGSATV